MNPARREQLLFGARCDIRYACTGTDKHGVAHGLSPEEAIEQLQTIQAHMARNTGYDFAEQLSELIQQWIAELQTEEPELDAFKTLEPRRLDTRIERVEA
jgi:hypothetical protein